MEDWIGRWEEPHKGKPVVSSSNSVKTILGVARSYIRHVDYNFPTALDPDAQNVETYTAAVTIGVDTGGMIYVFGMPKRLAQDLHDKLGEALGRSRTT